MRYNFIVMCRGRRCWSCQFFRLSRCWPIPASSTVIFKILYGLSYAPSGDHGVHRLRPGPSQRLFGSFLVLTWTTLSDFSALSDLSHTARKPKPSAHQDVASITIHFTNNRSDLHYMDASGTLVHAPPPAPGVATVTPSSLLQALRPSARRGWRRWRSKLDAVIRCLHGCSRPGRPRRHADVTVREPPGHEIGPRTGLRLEGPPPPPPRWPTTPAMPPRHSEREAPRALCMQTDGEGTGCTVRSALTVQTRTGNGPRRDL
jgi:hypothetical protein